MFLGQCDTRPGALRWSCVCSCLPVMRENGQMEPKHSNFSSNLLLNSWRGERLSEDRTILQVGVKRGKTRRHSAFLTLKIVGTIFEQRTTRWLTWSMCFHQYLQNLWESNHKSQGLSSFSPPCTVRWTMLKGLFYYGGKNLSLFWNISFNFLKELCLVFGILD